MSTIAVVGATGTAGRPLAERLRTAGHDVRTVSRGSHDHPADLDTGRGLADALNGSEVVFDVANTAPRGAERILGERARKLEEAAARAGVAHLICLSIAGIDYTPWGYYRAKLDQERVVRGGRTPWTIVRCTQFHELLAGAFSAAARFRLSPRARIPLRPIAAEEAAAILAGFAQEPPAGQTVTVAGPRTESLSDLARAWAGRQPRALIPVPVPLGPKLGKALRSGTLVGPPPQHQGTITFKAWLG